MAAPGRCWPPCATSVAAVVQLTVLAGEHLTVGSAMWLPAPSVAAGQSHASPSAVGAMFGRETRMLLRHYLEHGKTKSALAGELWRRSDVLAEQVLG